MTVDSFWGRVAISLIDKLLIGLAASGLVLYFQYAQRETQLLNEQRLAVGSVWTQEITALRADLAESVSDFMTLVDQLVPTGQARGDYAERLDQLQGDIDSAVSWLHRLHSFIPEREESACYPRAETVLDTFTEFLTNELTLPLLSGRMEPQTVDEKLTRALALYVGVLSFVRCLTIDAFYYEAS